ncbi:MAG: hypothetical protein GY714_10625 [Desulfobacterales bacterium]|nr:hypothetical protein [Desulfobacterales bacterium]
MEIIEKTMTNDEVEALKKMEAIIEPNLRAFYVVGAALSKIRSSKLYRDDFLTWKEYCNKRWNLGKSHAHRLMEAAVFVESLCSSKKKDSIKHVSEDENLINYIGHLEGIPDNEGQIRPLLKLEPKDRVAVWEKAVNMSALDEVPVTGKYVSGIVDMVLNAPKIEGIEGILDRVEGEKKKKKKDVPDEFLDLFNTLGSMILEFTEKNYSGLNKKKIVEYVENLFILVKGKA